MSSTLTKIFSSPNQNSPKSNFNDIYFIAEIGINHNGDINLAKELIHIAKNAGCDAVKFQKRTIEIVYSQAELKKFRESPWGSTQLDQKKGLEFSKTEYDIIDKYWKNIGIDWSASAWDDVSLSFIENYNPPFHKVASAHAVKLDFLINVAKLKRPTFVSTGMCDENDVSKIVDIFREFNTPLILMHTVSTYPTDPQDLNLLCIPNMKKKFGVPVGYSGHESSTSPTLVAAALGAVAIERHITKSRALYGSDQAASLEPQGLMNLVGAVRKVPLVMGDGIKKVQPNEILVAKKLRYWLEH